MCPAPDDGQLSKESLVSHPLINATSNARPARGRPLLRPLLALYDTEIPTALLG
jgi:hypothetical protein